MNIHYTYTQSTTHTYKQTKGIRHVIINIHNNLRRTPCNLTSAENDRNIGHIWPKAKVGVGSGWLLPLPPTNGGWGNYTCKTLLIDANFAQWVTLCQIARSLQLGAAICTKTSLVSNKRLKQFSLSAPMEVYEKYSQGHHFREHVRSKIVKQCS